MSGGNYFISVKQIIESEKKIKLASLLQHSGIAIDSLTLEEVDDDETTSAFEIDLPDDACESVSLSDSELQVIFYVSGFCGYRVKKNIKCPDCLSMFVSDTTMPTVQQQPSDFFHFINRGKLNAPSDQLFTFLCRVYSLFCCLKTSAHFSDFLRRAAPAKDFISLVEKYTCVYDLMTTPSCGHYCCQFWQQCIRSFFNCLSRNLIRGMSAASNNMPAHKQSIARKIHKLRSKKM